MSSKPQLSPEQLAKIKENSYSRADITNIFENGNKQAQVKAEDPFRQVSTTSFNAGKYGLNAPRYYNHPAYNRLGFNPYIDNETYYNQNSSAWEDFKRTSGQWTELAGLGFSTVWGNDSDVQEALKYEEASMIGSTSRGGIFGTFNDVYLNSGYTIGLMSEIALEEVALGIATVATDGAAAPVAEARTAKNLARLNKIGTAGVKAGKFGKQATSAADALKDLNNISKAKTVYNGLKKVGSAVNPLTGTTELYKAYKAGDLKKFTALSNLNKSFGSFYRDIREINLALDESNLEAGFVKINTSKELYNEFVEKYGRAPQGEEMDKISELATKYAESGYLMNAGLIYATNRMAFGGFFRKFRPKFGPTMFETSLGKVAWNRNFKQAGKQAFEKVGTGVKETFKRNFSKAGLKQSPLNTLKFLGKYTRVNFGEGFQEFGQEVIQDAMVQRAKDDYYGMLRGGYYNYLSSSVDKFSNQQGLDVFMSGFLMGGMVGPYVKAQQFALEKGMTLGQRVFSPGEYQKEQNYKAEKEKHLDNIIVKLNEIANNPTKYFNMSSLGALVDQTEVNMKAEEAAASGKEKEFRDIEDEGTAKALLFALKSGHYDRLVDQLKDMSDLSEKELIEAYGTEEDGSKEELGSFRANADKIISRAKDMKQFYDYVEDRYKNPYEQGATSDIDDGISEAIKYEAFESAKMAIVLNNYSFKRTLDRMASIQRDLGNDTPFWNKNDIAASDINILLNSKDLNKNIELLTDEIKLMKQVQLKGTDRSELSGKEKKLEKLKEFKEHAQEYRTALGYAKALTNMLEKEEDVITGAEVNILTKKGGTARIVGETTTKGGKPAWKLNDGRVIMKSKVELNKTVGQIFQEEEVDPATNNFYKTFSSYMKSLSDDAGTYIDQQMMEPAFQRMLDFYALEQDAKNMSSLISRLEDPKAFDALVARQNAVHQKLWEDKEEDIKNDLQAYYKAAENNKLLDTLAKKHGVFILEEELEDLLEENEIPEDFYDIKENKAIRRDSNRYADVVKEIQDFLEKTGRVEEVKEEAATTEPETKTAEPETDTETKEPIARTAPYETWPASLKAKAEQAKAEYDKKNKDNEGYVLQPIEEWVGQGRPGFFAMKKAFEEWNGSAQPVTQPVAEEKEKAPAAPVEETTEAEKVVVKEFGDAVTIPLSTETVDSIINGTTRMFTMEAEPAQVAKIQGQLRKMGIMDSTQKLDNDDLVGRSFVSRYEVGDKTYNVILSIEGRIERLELVNADMQPINIYEVISDMGLPKEESDIYKYPVQVGSETYFSASENEAKWLQGKGKMYVFNVMSVQEVELKKATPEADQADWAQEIKNRLSSMTLQDEIDFEHTRIVAENSKRARKGEASLSAAELEKMYQDISQETAAKLSLSDFKVGEQYEMKGKLSTFGIALVEKVTKTAVVFRSAKTKELSKPIPKKDLASVIARKTTDMEEEVAETSLEFTPEEVTTNQENKNAVEEFAKDASSIGQVLDEADKLSAEDVDSDFMDNLGCE